MSGRETSFDLSAGALCLDFANTRGDRSSEATEELRRYPDLIAFFAQTGMLDERQERSLHRLAAAEPTAARAALGEARRLREAIYLVFSAFAGGRPSPHRELDRLNRALAAGAGRLELVATEGGFSLRWHGLDEALTAALGPVAHAASELLISGELDRVRECGGAGCDWLFLDKSRNRSRRWCSMETCGNRSKARRHYHRQRRR